MYTGNSIVDYLKSIGKDSSKTARQKYAQDYGISSYDFSAQKNIELLNKMRQSQTQKTSQPVQNYSSKTQNNYNQQNKSFTNNQVKDNFGVSKNNINTQKNSSQNQMKTKNLNTEQKKNLDNQLKNLGYDDNQIQDYYKKNKINYSQEDKNKSSSFGGEIKRKENEKWDFGNSNILPSNITGVQTNRQTEDKKYTPVQSFDEWVQRGKKPTELVDLVENKYGINAEYDAKNNKILGYDKNGNLVKSWTFDEGKNPIRTDHKVYTNDDFLNDFNNILATGDNKQIGKFLQKNKKYYDENKDYVTTQVKQYIKQKEINDKVKKLSSLDGKGLWNASINGEFVQGDDVFNALPYEKQQEFLAFQKRYVRQDAKDPNKKIIADLKSDDAEEVYNKMSLHNPKYQENFQKIVLDNEDRKRLEKEALLINEKINDKRAELQKLERKYKEKYPSASPSFIQAMINRDSGVLLDEIEDLKAEYDTTVASYNMVNADAMAEYQAYQMDAQVEYNTYQKAIDTTLKRIDLIQQSEINQENQKELLELKFEQDKYLRNLNKDITLEIKKWDKEHQDKKGVYQTNDKGELLYLVDGKAEKVLDNIGEVVSIEHEKDYQEILQKNKYGGYDVVRTFKDGRMPEITSYNADGKLIAGVPGVISKAINKVKEPKQCGAGVNDYLQNLGLKRVFGNDYKKDKLAFANSNEPVIGGIAIWQPAGGNPKYGHVGIVTGITEKGDLEITDWNYNNDGKKQTHVVPRNIIDGYYIPDLIGKKQEESQTGTSYISEKNDKLIKNAINGKSENSSNNIDSVAQSYLDMYNKGGMSLKDIYTKIGSSKGGLEIKNKLTELIAKQGGTRKYPKDDEQVRIIKDLETRLGKALKSDYLNDVSGTIQTSWSNWYTRGKTDLLADLRFVLEGNTLQQLIDAKQNGATFGALSNEELEMLRASASVLNANAIRDKETQKIVGFDMSEEKLKEELQKMYDIFDGKLNKMTGEDKELLEEVKKLNIKIK